MSKFSHLSAEERKSINRLITEAKQTKLEIKDISDALRDTIKSKCEEFDIPVRAMNKAISMAMNDNREEEVELISDAEYLDDLYRDPNTNKGS